MLHRLIQNTVTPNPEHLIRGAFWGGVLGFGPGAYSAVYLNLEERYKHVPWNTITGLAGSTLCALAVRYWMLSLPTLALGSGVVLMKRTRK